MRILLTILALLLATALVVVEAPRAVEEQGIEYSDVNAPTNCRRDDFAQLQPTGYGGGSRGLDPFSNTATP